MGNISNNILVVDDDPETLDILKRLLENEGYMVDTVENPLEALKIISSKRYAVVLSDIMMPDITGHGLIKKILQMSKGIQVILMTAYSSIDKVLNAYELGASDYLLKPFDREDVLQVVARSCEVYSHWFTAIKKTLAEGKERNEDNGSD